MGINLAVTHYHKCVFREDANEFNPPRWLDHRDAVTMDKYVIHFGAGLSVMGRESPFQSSFIVLSFYHHSIILHC